MWQQTIHLQRVRKNRSEQKQNMPLVAILLVYRMTNVITTVATAISNTKGLPVLNSAGVVVLFLTDGTTAHA